MKIVFILLILMTCLHFSFAQVAHWSLEGNFLSSTGQPPLAPIAVNDFSAPRYEFVTESINDASTTVLHLFPHTALRLQHCLTPLNGSNWIKDYTVIMDVKFSDDPSLEWNNGNVSLLNSALSIHSTHGGQYPSSIFGITDSGGIGYGNVTTNIAVQRGVWNRLAYTYNSRKNEVVCYINGIKSTSFPGSGSTAYRPQYLFSTVILLGNSNLFHSNSIEYWLSNVIIYHDVLTDDAISALGKPAGNGFPAYPTPKLVNVGFAENNYNTLYAERTYKIIWSTEYAAFPISIDLYRQADWMQTINQTSMGDQEFLWTLPPDIPEGEGYQIRISDMYNKSHAVLSSPFVIFNPRFPLNPRLDENLIKNPGFEEGLQFWKVIEGNPTPVTKIGKDTDVFEGFKNSKGEYFLAFCDRQNGIIEQTIDLLALGFTPKQLDENLKFNLEMNCRFIRPNQITGQLIFTNEKRRFLSNIEVPFTYSAYLPKMTRFITIRFEVFNPLSENTCTALDDVFLSLRAALPQLDSETILNHCFEINEKDRIIINWEGSSKNTPAYIDLTTPVWIIAGVGDFNGDGKEDLAWGRIDEENATHVRISLLDGNSILDEYLVGRIDPGWKIAGVGDFNGDGNDDLVWRRIDEINNGLILFWLLDGDTLLDVSTLYKSDPNWKISGVGDFDGDGKEDLVWRMIDEGNTTNVRIWFLDGTTLLSDLPVEGGAPGWKIAGVGDFNGDGKEDLIWRMLDEANTTNVRIWFLDGTTLLSDLPVEGGAPGWKIAGVGDFNGDGKEDLVWRTLDETYTRIWLLSGTTKLDVFAIDGMESGWEILRIGDFDGDKRDDLVWQVLNETNISNPHIMFLNIEQ